MCACVPYSLCASLQEDATAISGLSGTLYLVRTCYTCSCYRVTRGLLPWLPGLARSQLLCMQGGASAGCKLDAGAGPVSMSAPCNYCSNLCADQILPAAACGVQGKLPSKPVAGWVGVLPSRPPPSPKVCCLHLRCAYAIACACTC